MGLISLTRLSLLEQCTIQPSFTTVELRLLVCLMDWTTRIRGMLVLVEVLGAKTDTHTHTHTHKRTGVRSGKSQV